MSIPNTTQSNVFVYGTLKREMFNHKMLTNGGVNSSRFVGGAETSQPYTFSLFLSQYGFPYLVENEASSSPIGTVVRGELYVVNEDKLAELDVLEDVASGLYERRVINVELLTDDNDEKVSKVGGEKKIISAFAYVAGEKEDKSTLARIQEYTKDIQDEKYIPKIDRGKR